MLSSFKIIEIVGENMTEEIKDAKYGYKKITG